MTDARSAMNPGLLMSDRSLWRPRFSRDAGWILRIFRAACVLFVLFASNMRTPSEFAWSLYDRAAVWQSGGVATQTRPVTRSRPAAPPSAADPQSKTGGATAPHTAGSDAR